MDTEQAHAEATIPPRTDRWPRQRQLGFGLVALIPLTLLTATFFCWFLQLLQVGLPYTAALVPVLFYTHVGAQFITILVFGHLMVANATIGGGTKLFWAAGFLFFAPFAVPTYWALHVWNEEATVPYEGEERRPRHQIHVYDYDYETHQKGEERRPDGSVVHHVDVG